MLNAFRNFGQKVIYTFTGPATYAHFASESAWMALFFYTFGFLIFSLLVFANFHFTWQPTLQNLPTLTSNYITSHLPDDFNLTWQDGTLDIQPAQFSLPYPDFLPDHWRIHSKLIAFSQTYDTQHVYAPQEDSTILVTPAKAGINANGIYQFQPLTELVPDDNVSLSKSDIQHGIANFGDWWAENWSQFYTLGTIFAFIAFWLGNQISILFDTLLIWGILWLCGFKLRYPVAWKWSQHMAVVALVINLVIGTPIQFTFVLLWLAMGVWLLHQRWQILNYLKR